MHSGRSGWRNCRAADRLAVGEDVRSPLDSDLRRTVNELLNESIAGMLESDYAGHPNAWLRYGDEEGPVFVADAIRAAYPRRGW
jgi:hypothetical protein